MNLVHAALTVSFGFGFILFIRALSFRGLLSMRYTLGWIVIGLSSISYVPILLTSRSIAGWLNVQPIAVLLGFPLFVLVLVTIQLSISVSGITEEVRVLAETIAMMENHLTDDPPHDSSTRHIYDS
jgi:hypothetical protein